MPFAFSHFHSTNISIKHISGPNHEELVKNKYLKYSIDAAVITYSEKIYELYDWADLVICRAGSTSISELAKIGIAALLIPFPHATDNHQFFNASYLAKNSAAILLEEKIDFIENFITITNILLNDQKRMYMLSKNIQNIFPSNTIKIIVEDSLKLIK
jgi:UDP-N-acetylglucosamine--N-acetylmuramyl-(pentapeptide) pyrophosphoryl-undecaprenol N-acetylglucosamine transferase